jgi:hypothetical protein
MNRAERVAVVFIVVVVAGIFLLFVGALRCEQRLLNECLADGYKHWECVSMLRGRTR